MDHFDLWAGPAIYRVLLFRNGLEADVSVSPEPEFGARGPARSLDAPEPGRALDVVTERYLAEVREIDPGRYERLATLLRGSMPG